ncbi:gastrula zinc finger protein XlCGF57.1-like [Lutzomyia longipalpis]|uniref:gastrula zinc finger protein XlCGF57.1-like n=1 Tax=Lutzomyia longipalpis TaxID=7200 RepID=UPI0024837EAB|nr:gastrula zinc finger protein XlCGF57.1-like [Lutzomyia longipalpis]
MNIDANVICRICLQSERLFHSIFEELQSLLLVDIVTQIANISINKDDKLPQQICHDCTTKFIAASDIRRLAIESDCFLKENLRTLFKEPQEDGSEISLQKSPSWADEQQELKKTRNAEIAEAERNQISCDGSKEDEDHEEALEEFSCETCGKVFQSHLSMRRHTKYHLLDRIKCPLCPRNFSQMSNLKRHLIVHSDMKEFHCDRCSELFGSISALYEHIKNHINTPDSTPSDYVMRCEVCRDFSTASYVEFRNHMRREHQVSGTIRPFICCICGIRFTSKQGMFRHIDNIHENNRRNLRNRDKNFLCTTCGKSFYTNFHLEVHVRSHTGQRPFKCQHPDCHRAFSQLSGLKMHTYTHTGEKPFCCKICGKSFNQYGHVREHMLIHSDIRPHVCKICNHSFRVKGNLTAHMMIHSGKKPYICSLCFKSFAQGSKLRQHMDKKHPN